MSDKESQNLDNCCMLYKQGYKAISHPDFEKSDHNTFFFMRKVQHWSTKSEAMLHDMLNDVDWDLFQSGADNINKFPDKAVREDHHYGKSQVIPNQKLWVDRLICVAVSNRTAAYNAGFASGDMSVYKEASYGVQPGVRNAKHWYWESVESHFQPGNTQSMWHGLHTIMDCKANNNHQH